MINRSFYKWIFPDFSKVANFIPIHKKGAKLGSNSYRTISVLSNISKLYEKLMHIWLINFPSKNKIFSFHQFGLRNNYSYNHLPIVFTEIIKNLDNDSFACGVFIGLKKAFDTVNQDKLLSKLSLYGTSLYINFLMTRISYMTVFLSNTLIRKLSLTYQI